ncbi:MAG: PAS domain S-box protein [Rhodocyclaceae bacterium]|nr:PAS domain S-box protein [Rhodocyclaceae bacterium]
MFGRLTIAMRLGLGFGLLFVMLALAVALGLSRLEAVHRQIEQSVVRDWESTVLANRTIDLMNAQTRDSLLLFHALDSSELVGRIAQRVDTITGVLDELEARLRHAEARLLLTEIRNRRKAYVGSFLDASQMLREGLREAAARQLQDHTIPTLEGLMASVDALLRLQGSLLEQTAGDSLQQFLKARIWLVSLLAAAALLALGLSIWIFRAVVRPLGGEPEAVRAVVERIASGSLDSEIALRAGDHDSLLAAMQTMQRNLSALIAARVRADDDLRESRQRFQELVETLRDWVWEVDQDWRYTYASPQVFNLLGYRPEELVGRTPFELMPPEEATRVRALAEAARRQYHPLVALENLNRHRSGRLVVLESSGRAYFDPHGNFLGYRGIDREITDRKQAEQARLDEALRLRDALVREVHHRIKNNLQTVVGLLRRQVSAHPDARGAIDAAIAQVQAVAVVHGLYGRVSGHRLRLAELLQAVAGSVSELTGARVELDGLTAGNGGGTLRESETVAVALILNELITNAVKYAEPDETEQRSARVLLSVHEGGCSVRIENRGTLPHGFDFAAGTRIGTGLGLVRALKPDTGMRIRFGQGGAIHRAAVRVEVVIEAPVLKEEREEREERCVETGPGFVRARADAVSVSDRVLDDAGNPRE